MVFQPKSVDFNSRHNPSQAFPEKHVLYSRQTETAYMLHSVSIMAMYHAVCFI